jgi:hypothetical protein
METEVLFIDPPSGWKYGFPKPAPTPPKDMNAWLVANGYPQHLVDYWVEKNKGVPCNMFFSTLNAGDIC